MENLNLEYPEYGWAQNKGYPTAFHRSAIAQFGSNLHHRKSFTLLAKQITLF
jgi:ribonuclease HII